MQQGRRRVEASALAALAPAFALLPVWVLAMTVLWWPLHLLVDVDLLVVAGGYLAAGLVLFVKPLQVVVLARLLGARRPTREERARLDTAWRSVLQAAGLPRRRYVLAVLPADELNAFACGGHLVIVTTFALETLPRDELAGVLAHELCHHLGFHTVALTFTHWLSAPVVVLARIGFFLQSVASAATTSYASNSAALTTIGRTVSGLLTGVSWVFLSGIVASHAVGGAAARRSEFQADDRAVALGFGPELGNALRRFVASGLDERPQTWRERLAAGHPAARTRVARIEAARRSVRRTGRPSAAPR